MLGPIKARKGFSVENPKGGIYMQVKCAWYDVLVSKSWVFICVCGLVIRFFVSGV